MDEHWIDRELVGWGRDLDPASRGRALAGLGTALGVAVDVQVPIEQRIEQGASPERLRSLVNRTPSRWWRLRPLLARPPEERERLLRLVPPDEVAEAWRYAAASLDDRPVRLRIEPFAQSLDALEAVSRHLAGPDVGAAPSVIAYHPSGRSRARPFATWAFVGSTAAARELRVHREDFGQRVDPAGTVDLLIVASEAGLLLGRAALPSLESTQCVLFVGREDPAAVLRLAEISPRGLPGSPWGASVVTIRGADPALWLDLFFTSLRDGVPLDVGLSLATPDVTALLVADPPALDQAVPPVAGRAGSTRPALWSLGGWSRAELLGRLRAGFDREADVAFDRRWLAQLVLPDLAPEDLRLERLGMAEPPQTMAEPPQTMAEPPEAGAEPEPEAEIAEAAAASMPEEPQTQPERYLQTNIWPHGPRTPAVEPVRAPLEPSHRYAAEFWIAHEIVGTAADVPIGPLPALAPDETGHVLDVVFVGLTEPFDTDRATIRLPRSGPSTPCEFAFSSPPRGPFRARVLVLHKNRIVQSAILAVAVGRRRPAAAAAGGKPPISLTVEVVRATLAGLESRTEFDGAISEPDPANRDEPAVGVFGDKVVRLRLDGISGAIAQVTALLKDVADLPPGSPDRPFGPEAETILWNLAHKGSELRRFLTGGDPATEEALKNATRVQLVSAASGSVLPIEIAYSLPIADGVARLCGNAPAAARDGRCSDLFHADAGGGNYAVVCPSGFWAVNRVIERNGRTSAADVASGADATLRFGDFLPADPQPGNDSLPPLTRTLCAASVNVDNAAPRARRRVRTTLQQLYGKKDALWAPNWREWLKLVEKRPSLLILLSHSANTAAGPALELEADDCCTQGTLGQAYVTVDREAFNPLVLLLGCETAIPLGGFQTWVASFRGAGAAIVVATLAEVDGAKAANMAVEIVQALHQVRRAAGLRSFGDVLTDVRRCVLSTGDITSLSVAAYGDADWKL